MRSGVSSCCFLTCTMESVFMQLQVLKIAAKAKQTNFNAGNVLNKKDSRFRDPPKFGFGFGYGAETGK